MLLRQKTIKGSQWIDGHFDYYGRFFSQIQKRCAVLHFYLEITFSNKNEALFFCAQSSLVYIWSKSYTMQKEQD